MEISAKTVCTLPLTFRFSFGIYFLAMNMNVLLDWQKTIVFLLFPFFLSIHAWAGEKSLRHPFDPNDIPFDTEWNVVNSTNAMLFLCGEEMLGISVRGPSDKKATDTGSQLLVYKLNDSTWQTRAFPSSLNYVFPLACTANGRYLFAYKGWRGKLSVSFFDTKDWRELAYFSNAHLQTPISGLVSPDSKTVLWFKNDLKKVDDALTIRAVPILQEFSHEIVSIAWSKDSKKAYILLGDKEQVLAEYDLTLNDLREFPISYENPPATPGYIKGLDIKVHPETGKIYIHAGIKHWATGAVAHEEIFSSRANLYVVDPMMLPKEQGEAIIHPVLLGDIFATFDFGPDRTIIFSMFGNYRFTDNMFTDEFRGLYLANLDGKVLRRITKGTNDMEPFFWHSRNAIFFVRETWHKDEDEEEETLSYRTLSITRNTPPPAK